MSAGFLIGPYNHNGYEIDLPLLHDYISTTWKNVRINDSGISILNWEIHEQSYSALCDLQNNKQTVSIYGTGGTHLSTATIAIWYRAFVPSQCELFLYSGSRWDNPLELTSQTTLEDVISWLSNE
jgi:hypothetical protein